MFGVDPATLEQVEDNGKLSVVITIYRDAVIRYNNVMDIYEAGILFNSEIQFSPGFAP